MAELTTLEEKLAEVLGPAQAAQGVTEKVASLVEDEISGLVEWALPIQERHFAEAKDGSLKLAGEKDPYEES